MFGCSVLPDCEIVRAGVWLDIKGIIACRFDDVNILTTLKHNFCYTITIHIAHIRITTTIPVITTKKVKSFNNSVCVIGGCLKDKGVDPGIRYCKTFDHKLKFAIAICIRNRETVLDVSARKLWTGSSDQVGR